jgi:ABC-2 type transport system permease protein
VSGTQTASSGGAPLELVSPARSNGMFDVVHERYLLRLLVRRELKARYQGSLLGLGWSYVRPAVQFCVYFFVVGTFLGLRGRIENFPIYLFSGMVLITLFNETLTSTTRSVVQNRTLVNKVYLPRELFPVASLLVSLVHFLPGMVVLIVGALVVGWTPSVTGILAALLAIAIVIVCGMAIGLACAAFNVFFRDFEKAVEVMTIVTTWSVPMIYTWASVSRHLAGTPAQKIYLANPLVSAVSLMQRAFWKPTVGIGPPLPPHLYPLGGMALVGSCLLLGLGQLVFGRLQNRFAEAL